MDGRSETSIPSSCSPTAPKPKPLPTPTTPGDKTPGPRPAGTAYAAYTCGYNDTTSNRIKFGPRYYHPARGRFTQPDPSKQEQNPYLYAVANPVNLTDKTGLDFLRDVLGDTLGSVVGTIGAFGLGLATKSTPAGIVGGFALGCVGGLVEEAIANAPEANYGEACAKKGIVGGVTGGLGGLLGKAFPY